MEDLAQHMESGWREILGNELKMSYFRKLELFLAQERTSGKLVFPAEHDVFRAFVETPFSAVKVVILGQDPYHGAGQAHGLAFSVPDGVKTPPSLRNIFKEIQSDLQMPFPLHSNLVTWARQGVLLLNAVLTVEADKAGSHQKKGWEQFTDSAVHALSENHQGLIFLLWGNHAREKARHIDTSKHHLLFAPHPSPLSAFQGFFGCRHFSKANAFLKAQDKTEIDWFGNQTSQV